MPGNICTATSQCLTYQIFNPIEMNFSDRFGFCYLKNKCTANFKVDCSFFFEISNLHAEQINLKKNDVVIFGLELEAK